MKYDLTNELMNLNITDAESPLTTCGDGIDVSNKAFKCSDDSVNPSHNVEPPENVSCYDLKKLTGTEDVVNLSTFHLNPSEKSVLSYGLNF